MKMHDHARKADLGKQRKRLPILILIAAAAVLALAGLWLSRTPRSAPPAAPAGWSPPGPQAKLSTIRLWLGSQELVAEVARPPDEIHTGLMFRTTLASNEAMLFLLPVTQQAAFYMRNTLIPLSCAYLDDEGVILEIHDMKPKDETTILSASANVRYVVEANRGWFLEHHLGPGILVRTERGALAELLKN